jgi:hypothetical protein
MIYQHHACATGPSPVTHSASRSMTSPAPSVTVMIRPAADETTTRDGRPLWPKQTRHTSQMDRFRMRGEELAVAAPARPSGRDGVMASPPLTTTAAAAMAAGRCWSCLSARADSLHSHVYDQAERCPIHLRVWTDSQAIGGGPGGR